MAYFRNKNNRNKRQEAINLKQWQAASAASAASMSNNSPTASMSALSDDSPTASMSDGSPQSRQKNTKFMTLKNNGSKSDYTSAYEEIEKPELDSMPNELSDYEKRIYNNIKSNLDNDTLQDMNLNDFELATIVKSKFLSGILDQCYNYLLEKHEISQYGGRRSGRKSKRRGGRRSGRRSCGRKSKRRSCGGRRKSGIKSKRRRS